MNFSQNMWSITRTQLFSYRKTCIGSSPCCPTVLSLYFSSQDHHHCHCEYVPICIDTTCNRWKDQQMDSHPPRIWLRLCFSKVQKVIGLRRVYFGTSGWVRWRCAWGIAYLGGYDFDWIFRPLVRRYTDLSLDFEVPHLCFSWWASSYMPLGQELSHTRRCFIEEV